MSRHSGASRASSSVAEPQDQDEEPTPPFFNTTFSTHRVSPLYVGQEKLTEKRLETLGRRLRELLVGDVIRGIQIGLEATETPTGQVGLLRSVKLRWFHANAVLGDEMGDEGNVNNDADSVWNSLSQRQKQGLWIEIRHENAAYIALLLPGAKDTNGSNAPAWQMQPGDDTSRSAAADSDQFIHLPLMLLRMPLPLKNIIGEWLSTTFDCRVSKLALGTRTIVNVWEDWIRTMGIASRGPDFVITLAFHAPLPEPGEANDEGSDVDMDRDQTPLKPGLRSIDITIQPPDLRRFVRAGKGLSQKKRKQGKAAWETDVRERRRLAGGNSDNGWAWLHDENGPEQPFMDALARYLDYHLALNMFHPSVSVAQVSCGGFVLASSRLKVVRQGELSDNLSKMAWLFVTRLGQRISGEALPTIFT